MPYIDPKQRADIDNLIDALSTAVKKQSGSIPELTETAGTLNYAVTRLCLNVMGPPKYWKIAMVDGILSNVAREFYRRLAAPYEDKKKAEHGDVVGYDRG